MNLCDVIQWKRRGWKNLGGERKGFFTLFPSQETIVLYLGVSVTLMSLAYAFQVRNDQNGADFWGEKKKLRTMEHTTGIVLHWVKWAVCGLGLGTLFLYFSLRRKTKETLEGTRNLLVLFLLNHHYRDLQGFTGYDYPWQDNYNWKGAATCGEGRLATPSPWQLPWSIDLLRIVYRLYTIVGQHYNTLLHLWPIMGSPFPTLSS